MRKLQRLPLRNFSDGIWRNIQNIIAPLSSLRFCSNMDSNEKMASLIIRPGLEIIDEQLVASQSFYGIYNHIETDPANNVLFAVAGNGTIYDVENGAPSLTGDTAAQRTRFITYLGHTLRFNGVDDRKAWNGTTWIEAENATFTVTLSTGSASTFTASASTDEITSAGHGLSDGDIIQLTTAGTLPDPLEISTSYYVLNATTNTFQLNENIDSVVPINITDTGSGTHSWQELTYVINSTAHGLSNGDIIKLSTTDALPTGLEADTVYYVINATANTFQVSEESGGDVVGVTYDGTGTQTWQVWDAFDLSNIPQAHLGVEWRDRIYLVDPSEPDTLQYSSIANPNIPAISWSEANGAGSIVFEQEDGGGGIKGLQKVPGYVLVFKRHTMKRWNGSSTYPDDLINLGVPSQEAICLGRGMAMFLNEKGIWATNGGYPQRISRPVQDIIDAIDPSYLDRVTSYCDDMYAQWSIGDVEIDGINHTNCVLKFNLDDNSWNFRSYAEVVEFPALYVKDDVRRIACGNDDGEVFLMDEGTTDNGTAIPFQIDFHPNDFGIRGRVKTFIKASLFIRGVESVTFAVRTDSNHPAEYKNPAQYDVDEAITKIEGINLRANEFDIRISGVSKSGGVVFDGMEFDEKGVELQETKIAKT